MKFDGDKLDIWNRLANPPEKALKKITGGRLNGMTDIKPQWRFQAMTEEFGPVGFGWKYEIVNQWNEPGSESQVVAWTQVNVYYKISDQWSEPIPGVGGSMFIAKERNGLYTSDEAFKMSLTDALSVAFKAIGVAATIYLGGHTGSKYERPAEDPKRESSQSATPPAQTPNVESGSTVDAAMLIHRLDVAKQEGRIAESVHKTWVERLESVGDDKVRLTPMKEAIDRLLIVDDEKPEDIF